MADEWEIVELLGNKGNPVRYTCADGVGIAKGTALTHTDDRTVIATSSDQDPFAGVAAIEKVANDGSTTISAYTCGIFLANDNYEEPGTGDRVRIHGSNCVRGANATSLLGACAGICIDVGSPGSVSYAILIGSGL